MGASLRMLERDLKVAQTPDCISACCAHIPGEGYRQPSNATRSGSRFKVRKLVLPLEGWGDPLPEAMCRRWSPVSAISCATVSGRGSPQPSLAEEPEEGIRLGSQNPSLCK
jgi:hypothetical protein